MTDQQEQEQAEVEVRRVIGVPTSVSPEAQEYVRLLTTFAPAPEPFPDAADLAGWRAKIEAEEAMIVAGFEMNPPPVRSAIETILVGGVPVLVLTPDGLDDGPDQPTFLDLHGGGFILGGGDACRALASQMAAKVQMRTWSVDYRKPPDHPYPAALDDCLEAYTRLLEVQPPERIVVGGASAGGNLAAALVLRARDEGLPLPAALVLLTPEVDLTESGDSFVTHLGIDCVLPCSLAGLNALYAGGHELTDPYLSPLFGDLTPPFPPTFVQAGTRDLFLSNAVRFHRRLRGGGVEAELHVFEAMPHGGFGGAPEDDDLSAEIQRFIARHLQG